MTVWKRRYAKNRLSELVRQVLSDGVQGTTMRGESEVTVTAIGELSRLRRQPESLVAFLRASPLRELDLQPRIRDIGRELYL
jgi:hypothetical protein